MTTTAPAHRVTAVLRGDTETVTPLELFFDLVFVLAITQCTKLIASQDSGEGLIQGLLALGVLWWAWVGYAWLTSVVDPEQGVVRLVMFASMAALLVCAICVPHVFAQDAGIFAGAFAIVRAAQVVLFSIAAQDDPNLMRSIRGLAVSTAIGCAFIGAAALTDGVLQGLLWGVSILVDAGGPYLFGADGWKLEPHHFAERHGAFVLIALGESVVDLGTGVRSDVDLGVIAAAVIGVAVLAALWWLYFDVVALVASRRLQKAEVGREQNEIARDSFSYLHFPMVAGIVLIAVGFEKTLPAVGSTLGWVPAGALLGGTALYLLAHVAFRWRNVHRFSHQRVYAAGVCVVLLVVARTCPALLTLGALALVLALLVTYERVRYADLRERLRHQT